MRKLFAITKICWLVVVAISLSACVGGSEQSENEARFGDVPIAYVIRVTPRDEDGIMVPHDLQDLAAFYPGAALVLRDAASPGAPERIVTAGLFEGDIDVRDLSVSPDGRQLVFALRAPEIEDADEDEQPTWNIWVLDRDSGDLRRVISNDLVAEEGQDIQPAFLPDGRILFVSNRQRQALARLLNERKPQFTPQEENRQADSFTVHVMNADGSGIRQVSFNMSHDLWPRVMPDGRMLFLRWDNKGLLDEFNLYRQLPDGRAMEILYGADSHEPGDPAPAWSQPRLTGDGSVLVLRRPVESADWSVNPRIIDVGDFSDRDEPLPNRAGTAERNALGLNLSTDPDLVSASGRLAALSPLGDGSGRYLGAWAPCRLQLPVGGALLPCTDDNLEASGLVQAAPNYGLWIFDPEAGTQRPVLQPSGDRMITEAVVMRAGRAAASVSDGVPGLDLDTALFDREAAILDIRSVYDFAGAFNPLVDVDPAITTLEQFRDPALLQASQRRARFLRVTKGVLLPDRDVREIDADDIGRIPQLGMREIVGYIPVQPDGSVRVEVPANVPLGLQLVDEQGRAILPRHGTWLTLRPGETRVCGGCHLPADTAAHGRPDAEPDNINAGAAVTGLPFPNTRPALFADAGETMAQVLTRIEPDRLTPTIDLLFEDVWTDPMVRAPDPSTALTYAALSTPVPVVDPDGGPVCTDTWTPLCRTVIHYLDHVQPLWTLPRTVDIEGVLTDVTCTGCHSRRDDMGMLREPVAQLELTDEISGESQDHIVSYRELLFPDARQEIVDGALVDALVPLFDEGGNPVYETDENGELILDGMGNPIQVEVTEEIAASMQAGSALASSFFARFAEGGSHQGWLSDEEIRLLSEWLDIGGQYYNDPFAVPQ